ncbi:3-isopropylmalate dehydratase small subunit [Allopusillimonas soli]|uniref:3-isopropylmalate dehydratase n=1 Tax=Allopusillimonas soli TaxID=659016 RepID=A0A853FDP7_9BURK|nr:3-isopropylmalate dehydratase small subunit [Allopusillimonas soli]NYT38057.1 3-isopropylmalate dehydratase small subunit [Allopusillimonas soli]TEA73943.1 3-isopropylmalate dehydratase small subunit [Allopusillimonas soli]
MTPITCFVGQPAALRARDVDTDQIIPARFLKKDRGLPGGYGNYLFHDIASPIAFEGANILVAGKNFGCGSSREGAVYALADRGFRALIAPSFGDIFYNNCLKNGVLPIRLDASVVEALLMQIEQGSLKRIEVDLNGQSVRPLGKGPEAAQGFQIDPFWRECLVTGKDEVALTLSHIAEIRAFELAYEQTPAGRMHTRPRREGA